MKDAIGQEIQVGDFLFYGQSTARHQAYGVLEVVGFTAKLAKVRWVQTDNTYSSSNDPWSLQAPDHTVVITNIFNANELFNPGDIVKVPAQIDKSYRGKVLSVDNPGRTVNVEVTGDAVKTLLFSQVRKII